MTATARAAAPVHIPRRRPAPSPARGRHLRVVDPSAVRRERLRRTGVRCFVLAVAGAVLTVVVIHAAMAEREVRLDRVAEQTERAQRRYEMLRLDHARQSAPQAIIDRATGLGMVPAPSPRYLSAPGAVAEAPPPGDAATAAPLEEDWGKVKSNLVAAP